MAGRSMPPCDIEASLVTSALAAAAAAVPVRMLGSELGTDTGLPKPAAVTECSLPFFAAVTVVHSAVGSDSASCSMDAAESEQHLCVDVLC